METAVTEINNDISDTSTTTTHCSMNKADTLHVEALMKMIEAAKLGLATPCQCLGVSLHRVQHLPLTLYRIKDRNVIGNRWISPSLKEEKERSYVYYMDVVSLEIRRRDTTGASRSTA
jgi:hypothetical protein